MVRSAVRMQGAVHLQSILPLKRKRWGQIAKVGSDRKGIRWGANAKVGSKCKRVERAFSLK